MWTGATCGLGGHMWTGGPHVDWGDTWTGGPHVDWGDMWTGGGPPQELEGRGAKRPSLLVHYILPAGQYTIYCPPGSLVAPQLPGGQFALPGAGNMVCY